ncbi:MAG TPA: 4-(cytidine 5'-diphospho)-2-C-methyl-D-erythritol kinase [Pyrinomonadaceae bacterium]|nr:4-(cytidine 5'-diphospho)-2-C-methyl-D-erythritol kinase [Pyrinomonadaceae bacterium]
MNENGFTLPSFAKINWNLRVLGKRGDGFHELCTVFQTVSLHDNLSFSESDELILTCDNEKIPTDETNLIIKAAKILRERFDLQKGAKIHLEKRIPAPGGLGGGSSNAAVALLGLKKLWKLEISFDELNEIGKNLGSDVPLFFYGGTLLGTGRGTEIVELKDVIEEILLIVTPLVDVPTGEAFRRLNALHLTNFESKSILKICQIEAEKLDIRQTKLKNDFEESVFAVEPEVARVKSKLLEFGANQALLSGSGASVFAIFDKQETRQATIKALETEKDWRMFAVAAVSRDEYRAALEKVF